MKHPRKNEEQGQGVRPDGHALSPPKYDKMVPFPSMPARLHASVCNARVCVALWPPED